VLWSPPLQDFFLGGLRVSPNCNASLLCVLNKWRSIRILRDAGMLNSGSEAVAILVRGRRDVSPHDGTPRSLLAETLDLIAAAKVVGQVYYGDDRPFLRPDAWRGAPGVVGPRGGEEGGPVALIPARTEMASRCHDQAGSMD